MKNTLTLLFCLFISNLFAQSGIYGTITDQRGGDVLIGTSLVIQGTTIGAVTDFNGVYRLTLLPDVYQIVFSYTGYKEQVVEVVIKADEWTELNIEMREDASALAEMVVSGTSSNSRKSQASAMKRIERGSISKKEISRLKSKSSEKTKNKKAKRTKSKSTSALLSLASTSSNKVTDKPMANVAAGQLTAGEWKDLDHWSFWKKLMGNYHFGNKQKYWGYYPTDRFSVKLSDEEGKALANITINLLNDGSEVIWKSKTDNRGAAELWGNFFGGSDTQFKIQILQNGKEWVFEALPYEKGINSIRLPLSCQTNAGIDIAFVVDATNSMLDEIKYLKAEIKDVIERVEEETKLELRCGSVFYTDRHNEVPMFQSPFTTDHKQTIEFIQEQKNKSGGKEWAEAVDLGLSTAIREMDWDATAITRIVFLILDAPPHHNRTFLDDLEITIKEAARKGIKIIPIAGSGTDKKAEFLFKYFAMATNGTYAFLTNHSGIGNNHMEPEAKDYNIETLNDLLVRLVRESAEYHDCEASNIIKKLTRKKKLIKKAKNNKANRAFAKEMKCFPNPANDYFFVELEQAIDLFFISSLEGKILDQYPKLEPGQIKVNVSNWPAGIYFLHFYHEGKHAVEKLVVTHNN